MLLISVALSLGVIAMAYPHVRPAVVSETEVGTILQGLLGWCCCSTCSLSTSSSRSRAKDANWRARSGCFRPSKCCVRQTRLRKYSAITGEVATVLPGCAPQGRDEIESEKQVFGRTRDISETGLGAVIADPLEAGERVILQFPIVGQDHPLECMRWFAIVADSTTDSNSAPEGRSVGGDRQVCRMAKPV